MVAQMEGVRAMSGYERLRKIQERLEARGVKDIKFTWAWVSRAKPMSQATSDTPSHE
jgi:hypothetical protein